MLVCVVFCLFRPASQVVLFLNAGPGSGVKVNEPGPCDWGTFSVGSSLQSQVFSASTPQKGWVFFCFEGAMCPVLFVSLLLFSKRDQEEHLHFSLAQSESTGSELVGYPIPVLFVLAPKGRPFICGSKPGN